jgi:uncharacterized DUF497 family protein
VFEWDESKRRRNLARHGVDFFDVFTVFDARQRVEFEDIRKDYGERRYVILCLLEDRLFHVTYTVRGSRRRIISARKANRREHRIYDRYRNTHAGGPDH